jgi:hypothetical protein
MLRFNVIVVLWQRRLDFLKLKLGQRALKLIAAADGSRELHSQTQLEFGASILPANRPFGVALN